MISHGTRDTRRTDGNDGIEATLSRTVRDGTDGEFGKQRKRDADGEPTVADRARGKLTDVSCNERPFRQSRLRVTIATALKQRVSNESDKICRSRIFNTANIQYRLIQRRLYFRRFLSFPFYFIFLFVSFLDRRSSNEDGHRGGDPDRGELLFARGKKGSLHPRRLAVLTVLAAVRYAVRARIASRSLLSGRRRTRNFVPRFTSAQPPLPRGIAARLPPADPSIHSESGTSN